MWKAKVFRIVFIFWFLGAQFVPFSGYTPVVQAGNAALPFAPQGIACADVTEIPISECQALEALYNSTNGSGWTNKTNWLNTLTPSNWDGVTEIGRAHV